jgi:hypothetical protein
MLQSRHRKWLGADGASAVAGGPGAAAAASPEVLLSPPKICETSLAWCFLLAVCTLKLIMLEQSTLHSIQKNFFPAPPPAADAMSAFKAPVPADDAGRTTEDDDDDDDVEDEELPSSLPAIANVVNVGAVTPCAASPTPASGVALGVTNATRGAAPRKGGGSSFLPSIFLHRPYHHILTWEKWR